jgi:hypothetical protein
MPNFLTLTKILEKKTTSIYGFFGSATTDENWGRISPYFIIISISRDLYDVINIGTFLYIIWLN